MAKTIDCFIFFNELDLLEIRLHELVGVVDEFMLIEGTRTHQNKPKPLFFEEAKDKFSDFLPKINHVVVDKWPGFFFNFRKKGSHFYENWQREFPLKIIKGYQEDTNIIFSDVDEIPKASEVEKYKDTEEIKIFEQRYYNYWLNNICTYYDTNGRDLPAQKNKNGLGFWRGSVMVPRKRIKTMNKTRLYRDLQDGPIKVIEDGGWHFSYIGNAERVKKKLQSYAHKEYDASLEEIAEMMKQGTSVIPDEDTLFEIREPDSSLPKYVLENQERFKHILA